MRRARVIDEFTFGQLQFPAIEGQDFTGGRLDARRQGVRAAQDGVDARQKFARVEGLHDIIVSANFEADDAVKLLGASGEQDHGDVVGFTDVPAQREAIFARHHDVEDDEVYPVFLDRLARGLSIFDSRCAPPVLF